MVLEQQEAAAAPPIAPRVRPMPLVPDRVERFESFVVAFRTVFHRADQFLRFRAYVRGLLEPTERKNLESIAAAASSVMMVESNLAQSLQHFVTQSPWDHRRLVSAIRKQSAIRRRDPRAVWVVHDGVFAKKGRHSVGVQRQFARSQGRKINCQVGVFVVQVGPQGYYPLGARLYLPGHWLRENEDVAEKLIPEEDRRAASKADVALRLLQELIDDGESVPTIVAEGSYLSSAEFIDGLAQKGLSPANASARFLEEAQQQFEGLKAEFGLDHFEGRAWHGWHHHVALVYAAYHFLMSEL